MNNPIVYEVAPLGDAWVVRIASDSHSEAFRDKVDALSRARELASRESASVRVLTAGGRVEAEYAPPRPGART